MPGCALPGTPLAGALPGINACVHCGFCLQACPTYLNLEDENDSPRGRIFLMRSLLEGTVKPDDPSVQQHIDQCLG
jgi:glycolate oxidase iron-sulfur subunit